MALWPFMHSTSVASVLSWHMGLVTETCDVMSRRATTSSVLRLASLPEVIVEEQIFPQVSLACSSYPESMNLTPTRMVMSMVCWKYKDSLKRELKINEGKVKHT